MKITNLTHCPVALLAFAHRTAFDNRFDLKQAIS